MASTPGRELLPAWMPLFCQWPRGGGRLCCHPDCGSVPAPGGWNRLVLEVKDIEATVAALAAPGAKFRSKPIKGPGGKQVLVDDPSGNPIELFEPANDAA